jgi:hypothetical protein
MTLRIRQFARFSLIIASFLVISCSSTETSQDIINVLQPECNCEKTTTEIYSSRDGFCFNALFLNSDSTFVKEGGCEGRSNISLGQWKIVNDSIELQFKPLLNPVCNIQLSPYSDNNLKTTFFISDKSNNPVEHFVILPLHNGEKYTYTSNARIVLNSSNKEVMMYETDEDGKVIIDLTKCDSLEFPQLTLLTGKKYRFSSKKLPDSVKITMNIHAFGFLYPEVSYKYWDKPLRFKKLGHTLIHGDFIMKGEQ